MRSYFLILILLILSVGCNKEYFELPKDLVARLDDNKCDPAATPFGYGKGTANSPYRICSTSHFQELEHYHSAGLYFKQVADLDFSSVTFAPVASDASPFESSYDGGNFKLKNITYSDSAATEGIGIFKNLGQASVVKNLIIVNLSLTGNDLVGGIAAKASGKLSGLVVAGSIVTNGSAGGIVGAQELVGLEIKNSSFAGTVSTLGTSTTISTGSYIAKSLNTGVGGIIGYSSIDMLLEDLTVSAAITSPIGGRGNFGSFGVGGAVGNTSGSNTTIRRVKTSGTVSAKYCAGGVIGQDYSGGPTSDLTSALYTRLRSDATVTTTNSTGGLIGFMMGGNLHQSFSNGIVAGKINAGGVFGSAVTGSVKESFSAATIQETNNTACAATGNFMGQVFTWGRPFTIDDSFASGTINLTCSSTTVVAAFSGRGTGSANQIYTRVASFVPNSSLALNAFGSSTAAYLVDSVYLQSASIPSDPTASAIAITDATDEAQYATALDFATPLWKMTSANSISGFNHPVPIWVCELDEVDCL